jgi:hypothetical protein
MTKISPSEMYYREYHREFELWFCSIHPNNALNFGWEYVYDSGWYKEDMANGAWIVWLQINVKDKAND